MHYSNQTSLLHRLFVYHTTFFDEFAYTRLVHHVHICEGSVCDSENSLKFVHLKFKLKTI